MLCDLLAQFRDLIDESANLDNELKNVRRCKELKANLNPSLPSLQFVYVKVASHQVMM